MEEEKKIIMKGFQRSESEVLDKAKKIRLLVTDVDGVWTDGGIIFDNNRLEYKKFNVKDGLAVKLLRQFKIKTAVITGRRSAVVRNRCEEIGVDHHFHGIEDKWKTFMDLLEQTGINPIECAYIGDDLLDLPLLTKVGLSAAPADAMAYVRDKVDFVSSKNGGDGVFREVGDLILESKGHLANIINSYSK